MQREAGKPYLAQEVINFRHLQLRAPLLKRGLRTFGRARYSPHASLFDHTRPRFALLTFNERALCFLLMVRHQLMKISAMT